MSRSIIASALSETALITGASSGIGAATAKVFAENGYDLLLLGRNFSRLEKVSQECRAINPKVKVTTLVSDINQLEEDAMLDELKKISPLTTLVNNAGIYQQASVQENTEKLWQDMFQTNLLSAAKLTQHCWKIFSKNQKGSIVNVSSTLGVKPIPGTSAYSAIKAAMINWTLTLAQEGADLNIRANCICPGIIDTPIQSFHSLNAQSKKDVEKNISQMQLIKKLGQPENIAESIYFLASRKSSFTTGSVLHVDGGINIK